MRIQTSTNDLPTRRARPDSGYRSAGYYAMLAVLLAGLALAVWAVLAVHTSDVPAVRNRSGYNIEDAVDGCGVPAIGSILETDAAADAGRMAKEV